MVSGCYGYCYCFRCPALHVRVVVLSLLWFLICSDYCCSVSQAFIVPPSYQRYNTHYHHYQLSTLWTIEHRPFAPSSSSLRQEQLQVAASTRSNDRDMFWPEQQQQQQSQRHHADDSNNSDDDGEHDEDADKLSSVLDSIIKIHCTHSEPDYLIPWQRQHQSTSTSSGFVIALEEKSETESSSDADHHSNSKNKNHSHKRIMTNAHSVEYGSIVQVQRRGEAHKYEAVVEVIANECDLALLQVVDGDDFWQDLQPLQFGTTLPALQEQVEVLGYPTGGDSLSITSGVVSRMEMQEYSQASTHLLAIQIDAAINPGMLCGCVCVIILYVFCMVLPHC